MKADIKIVVDVLKTVWSEDFKGVEALRSSVYNVISALTVASFALSSFLINGKVKGLIPVATDGLMIGFIWTVFLILRRDIRNRRRALVFRQKLLEGLDDASPVTEIRIFGDASNEKVDIKDSDLIWIPLAGSAAIICKALIVWKI